MIDSFQGPHRWLSNFWPAPVTLDGVKYPTVEHAYQAAKTLDPTKRAEIAAADTPGRAKRLMGKGAATRDGWHDMKLSVMEDLLRQKFTHPHLRAMLLDTGEATLIEGNTWGDVYWGVCRGVGENRLGMLLMKIRAEATLL